MRVHPDRDVSAALTRLNDALCSWERATGRETLLLVIESGGDFKARSLSGNPIPDDVTDAEALRLSTPGAPAPQPGATP